MKNIKIWFRVFLLIMIVGFSSIGCVTKGLWKDKIRVEPYQERIISFYNNPKEEKIIFIGEKYHYIFDKGTHSFSAFLEAKKRLKLTENQLYIQANISRTNKQEIYTTINFQFNRENLNPEQKSWLEKHKGFHPIQRTNVEIKPYYSSLARPVPRQSELHPYMLNYQLSGKRYQANNQVNNQVVQLEKPIDIEVVEFKTDKKSMLYKIAMTPLSVTADAGLIVIGAGAAIIYAPFGLGHWAYKSITK